MQIFIEVSYKKIQQINGYNPCPFIWSDSGESVFSSIANTDEAVHILNCSCQNDP